MLVTLRGERAKVILSYFFNLSGTQNLFSFSQGVLKKD